MLCERDLITAPMFRAGLPVQGRRGTTASTDSGGADRTSSEFFQKRRDANLSASRGGGCHSSDADSDRQMISVGNEKPPPSSTRSFSRFADRLRTKAVAALGGLR